MPRGRPHTVTGATAHAMQCWAPKGLPQLTAIPTIPSRPRWCASVNTGRELVERTLEEMQAYLDERSEKWQEGGRGPEFQEYIEEVQATLESMSELTF